MPGGRVDFSGESTPAPARVRLQTLLVMSGRGEDVHGGGSVKAPSPPEHSESMLLYLGRSCGSTSPSAARRPPGHQHRAEVKDTRSEGGVRRS